MVAGIEKRLFEGDAKKGKMPKYSLNDLDNELFKYVLPLDFGFASYSHNSFSMIYSLLFI